MTAQLYRQTLAVMRKRGGPYAGLDIPEFYALVEALFSPEEAEVNNAMTRRPVTTADLAAQMARDEAAISPVLEKMADKGLCSTYLSAGTRYYQGAAFMPGIFEYQFLPGRATERDKKIARLIRDYKHAYTAAAGEQKLNFPVTRVITVDRKINAGNRIHTYDQVATYVDRYDPIAVGTCYCRHAAGLNGEDVRDLPMDVCMWFGKHAEYAIERLGGRRLTRQQARELLDRTEKAGLVHMSRNTTEEIDFLCNCDRWHCEVITGVLKHAKPAMFFNSGFQPRFDPDRCTACEACLHRCPAAALTLGDQALPIVNLDRCFGCAVCATGCPEQAIGMEAKPDFPKPPKTTNDLISALTFAPTRRKT
jgi:electron transport complex protein RnfB